MREGEVPSSEHPVSQLLISLTTSGGIFAASGDTRSVSGIGMAVGPAWGERRLVMVVEVRKGE